MSLLLQLAACRCSRSAWNDQARSAGMESSRCRRLARSVGGEGFQDSSGGFGGVFTGFPIFLFSPIENLNPPRRTRPPSP